MLFGAYPMKTVTCLCLRGCLCSLRRDSRLPPTVATGLPAVTVDGGGRSALRLVGGTRRRMLVGSDGGPSEKSLWVFCAPTNGSRRQSRGNVNTHSEIWSGGHE